MKHLGMGIAARPTAELAVAKLVVKMIGIGLFAGTMATYCLHLIDACFRGLR